MPVVCLPRAQVSPALRLATMRQPPAGATLLPRPRLSHATTCLGGLVSPRLSQCSLGHCLWGFPVSCRQEDPCCSVALSSAHQNPVDLSALCRLPGHGPPELRLGKVCRLWAPPGGGGWLETTLLPALRHLRPVDLKQETLSHLLSEMVLNSPGGEPAETHVLFRGCHRARDISAHCLATRDCKAGNASSCGGGGGDRREGCADKLVTEPRSQQIPGEPTKRDTQKLEETFVHVCVSIPEALGTPSQLPAPGSPSPGRRAGRLRCPGLEPPHWILPPQLRL